MTAMGGEVIAWSVQLLNNSSLTAHQKELNITAFREQTGRDSPIESHKTFTFGSLAFGFISKKDRHNKMGARSIMGIWTGLSQEVDDAHRITPIVWVPEMETWKLLKTHVCVQARVYEGIFPLTGPPTDCMIEQAPPVLLPKEIEDMEIEEEDYYGTDDEGEYVVEKVVNHLHTAGEETQFEIRYMGYGPDHDEWKYESDLTNAKDLITDYIAANKQTYRKGLAMAMGAEVIIALQEDIAYYEKRTEWMQGAARDRSKYHPVYPVYVNKQEHDNLSKEQQIKCRREATQESLARRDTISNVTGCA